jgi:hypothetical protein
VHDLQRLVPSALQFAGDQASGRPPPGTGIFAQINNQDIAQANAAAQQERENVAYSAQDKWLDQFGLNLIDAFELNAMTVLVRTNCFY